MPRFSRCPTKRRVSRWSLSTTKSSRSSFRSGHPFARRRAIPVDELDAGELLLLPVGHCLRDQVLGACTEFSRPPPPGRLGNSLETLRSMVASGLGITVLPTTALTDRYDTPLVKAVPFAEPRPKRRVAVAWRKASELVRGRTPCASSSRRSGASTCPSSYSAARSSRSARVASRVSRPVSVMALRARVAACALLPV